MNLNFRKTALLAGICSVFSLGYAPQLFAVSSTDTVEAVQQTKKITGVVSDAMGPIIGANVSEKGTTNGVITDIDGNFALNVKPGATIVVSFIGYVSQEIKITNQTTVNITLKEDSEMLDEVVVVGYGTMKKSDLSGASVSMSEDKIKGSIITNLDQSLQGRAAGVTAVSTSGAPGSSSSIRVRGQATINANAEPLYVIDGVIVQSQGQSGSSYGLGDALGNGSVSTISPLSTINPADIVSMEILKDASATAIYGAQGSNGVVLITTKRGKAGEAKFTYDGMFAVQRQTKRLDMMNLREYATYYNDLANMGEISDPSNYYADPSLLGVGTNWQDAIFQTALQHQHQISAQGGTEKIQYYVSASYMDQDGTIIGSNFNRYSFRANLDAQLKKWLKLGLTATYTATGDDLKLADSDEGLINYSLTTLPDIPIYNLDGSYATVVREGYTNPNPIALAMMDDILLDRQKLTGNIFFEVTPIKNLVWHAELGYDISSSKGERYKPMVDLGGWVRSSNESNIQKNSSTFWQLKNYVTYSGNIGDKHHYTAMVGQECWESSYDFTSVFNSGLPSDEVHNPALGTGTPTINAGFGSSSMASFFTRLTYNYADRYLGTYTYRYDGSSNFGPENRWAGFHSLATSWYNFYGFVCDGVYKDLEDLQTSPKPAKYPANGVFDRTNTVWVGDVKYKDISGPDGVPDGVIDDYDKTNIGSPMPKFTFGWTNTFRYKNFDLSVFINGSYGNKVYNYLSMKLTHMNSPWTNQLNAVNGRAQLVPINPNKVYEDGTMWYNDVSNVMVANPGASIPRATINDPNDNDRISDRYIEDGSYIRLKNISLGYTFPKKTIDKLGLSNLRIYANIQNLLTITGYDGYDPEIGASTSSVNVYGLDNGRYPSPTVYSFGLNVSF